MKVNDVFRVLAERQIGRFSDCIWSTFSQRLQVQVQSDLTKTNHHYNVLLVANQNRVHKQVFVTTSTPFNVINEILP